MTDWRSLAKRGLAAALQRSGAGRLLRARGAGTRVRIFGYHQVLPAVPAGVMPPLVISPRTLAAHLDHLVRAYDVWSIDDAVDLIAGRAARRPRRDVAVITFDDGYASVLLHAAPLLRARHLPATMYVPTRAIATGRPLAHDRLHALICRAAAGRIRLLGTPADDRHVWILARADLRIARGDTIGAADLLLENLPLPVIERLCDALATRVGEPEALPGLLDWTGVAQLAELGFTIGAHTISHAHLPTCTDAELAAELSAPRAEIGARIGKTPRTLAYPAGRHDARVARAAATAGYDAALTTCDRDNRAGDDLFTLGRKVLSDAHGPGRDLIAAQLDGVFTGLGLTRAVPGDRPPAEVPFT